MAKCLIIVALIALIAVSGVAARGFQPRIAPAQVSQASSEDCPLCTLLFPLSMPFFCSPVGVAPLARGLAALKHEGRTESLPERRRFIHRVWPLPFSEIALPRACLTLFASFDAG